MRTFAPWKIRILSLTAAVLCTFWSGMAVASTIYFSDLNNNSGASPSFLDGDILSDDTASGITDDHAVFLSESVFAANEDVDGLHLLSTTVIALSTNGSASIAGLSIGDEDIVLYDIVANTASLLFDGSTVFSANEDLNGFHLMSDGSILLSTESDAQIGGLSFENEDVVLYNPATGLASLFFDGDLHFSNEENIDAVSYDVTTGTLYLSTNTTAEVDGQSFLDGDVIQINADGSAGLYYTTEDLPGQNELDALYVIPEPSTALLMGLGLGLLSRWRSASASRS